jgi:hypothetical protein
MQELYIIRKTASYKPWRYSSTIYTTNGGLFHFLNENETTWLPDIDWSTYTVYDEDDEDFVFHLLEKGSVEPVYPFIVLGETEVYEE